MCEVKVVYSVASKERIFLPGFNLTVLVATSSHLAEILAMGLCTPGGN